MNNKELLYWQTRIFFLMLFGYANYHIVRHNYSLIFSDTTLEFSSKYQHIGWIFTMYAIVYGLGKLINGYLNDRSSSKMFLSGGLFFSGVLSFLAGFFDNIFILGGIYIINGYAQSMGFPAIAKLVSNWVPQEKLASRWSIIACSHQIGGVAIMVGGGYLLSELGWRYVLFIPGIIAVTFSIFLLKTVKDCPTEIGFKPIGDIFEQRKPSTFNSIFFELYTNKELQLLCLTNLVAYLVRMGILNWAPIFLIQYQKISTKVMIAQLGCYEVMGLFGTILLGYVIDRYFKSKISLIGAIYMLFYIVLFYLLWYLPQELIWPQFVLMGLIGFVAIIPQTLVGLIALKLSKKSDIGTIYGIVSLFGYIGTAISGIGTGIIVSLYGWKGSLIFFTLTAIIGLIAFIQLFILENRKQTYLLNYIIASNRS